MNIPTDLCSNRIGLELSNRAHAATAFQVQAFGCLEGKQHDPICNIRFYDGMCMRHVYIHAGE